ncbi:hypothetical protein PYCCODRAFT_1440593 [Trametes coccinea BRFM310]|uniref:Uncharacterized protein n=1 Tax=Trametes coccinea (strain BRFM310) TaxID=1353009 RepID=A0A1Y2I745_TRAC3|nr:hypothetical protein PYCCODRAFT_1440593 [Trametes coccinea BRFM310]
MATRSYLGSRTHIALFDLSSPLLIPPHNFRSAPPGVLHHIHHLPTYTMLNDPFIPLNLPVNAMLSLSASTDGALQFHLNGLQQYLGGTQASQDASNSLALLVQHMNQLCANQQAALEQAQRASEMMLQQQRMLTAATLRR